ncbi:unnamed protein product [Meloidogyne enterolobii]|uniref:Uncharacterized protein n=1 Tax=Meloidogyne enterolobii TaxID=390850 RepID=A0ACB0Z8R8_MELEN
MCGWRLYITAFHFNGIIVQAQFIPVPLLKLEVLSSRHFYARDLNIFLYILPHFLIYLHK